MGIKKNQLSLAVGSAPVKASNGDLVPGTLYDKVAAGTGVTLSVLNPGGNEQLSINAAQVALPFTTTLYAVPFTAEVNKINRVDGTVPALAIALPLGADGDVIGFANEGAGGSMVVTPDVGGPDFIFVPGNPAITINQPPVGAPIVTILRFNGSTKIWLPEDIFLLALSVNPRFIPTSTFDARPTGTVMLDNSLLASTGVGNDITALVIGENELVGRPVGSDLSSMTPSGARAILDLDFGTYTPVAGTLFNVSAAVPTDAQFMRVGNVVTVSGELTVTTLAAGPSFVEFSPPSPSNFTATYQCSGSGVSRAAAYTEEVTLFANNGSDQVRALWISLGVAVTTISYTFTYQIL
jgi:hypothetical protein